MKKKVGILAGTVLILALLTACDNIESVNKVISDHEVIRLCLPLVANNRYTQ